MAAPRLTRAEKQAQTRAALIEAAGRVFVERGFQAASVEAITAEAGFSRGAFYANFSSKEQLFAELLQEQAFAMYRARARRAASPREIGEQNAATMRDEQGTWRFRLWLELLAHASRDPDFRTVAAEFWKGTRELGAQTIARVYKQAGQPPPTDPHALASAFIALDVGLALQHFVDPDAVPLETYAELHELLFDPLVPGQIERT